MKAIVYERNGSPDVLEYREVDDPAVTNDGVIVRAQAISVEGGDLIARASAPPKVSPHIGGYQRAGVIEAVGADVKHLKPGQRVTAFNFEGAYAEMSCVPAHYVFPIPDSLGFESAVAIPATFGTAAQAILKHCGLTAGETILITGAAGGVGIAAVQLAKSVGATVIGTSSSDDTLQRLKELGMDHGINYKTQDIAKRCKEITAGQGVDLAMDNVGGYTIPALVAAAAVNARISVVGIVTDPQGSNYNSMQLIGKQLCAKGTYFGMDMHTPEAHELIADLIAKVDQGKLLMPIDKRFALENTADAHRYIESDASLFGRVILPP